MKAKFFLTAVMFSLAVSVSAQIQLLYMDYGRNVIDRNKKLYWMDGDKDPCYNIKNYKKTGNKESFRLESQEMNGYGKPDICDVVITLDEKTQLPVQITINHKSYGAKTTSAVKTTSGDNDEDNRLYKYFGELAGYPASEIKQTGTSVPTSAGDVKEMGTNGGVNKVKDAAKGALGKVKGVFKKKK